LTAQVYWSKTGQMVYPQKASQHRDQLLGNSEGKEPSQNLPLESRSQTTSIQWNQALGPSLSYTAHHSVSPLLDCLRFESRSPPLNMSTSRTRKIISKNLQSNVNRCGFRFPSSSLRQDWDSS